MTSPLDFSIAARLAQQARLASADKTGRPEAWESVERLKLACALLAAFPEAEDTDNDPQEFVTR